MTPRGTNLRSLPRTARVRMEPKSRDLAMSTCRSLSLATPTRQRDAETSRAFGGKLEPPPRCGHRKARDLRNDRAQPDMTQTFLKAIEDRLLVAAFEIDDRSDFRSAWARAGTKRSGRSRHHKTFPRVRAAIPATKRAAAAPSIAPLPPPPTSCSAPSARPPREAARRFQRARTATRSSRAGAALRSGGPGRAGLRCPMGAART